MVYLWAGAFIVFMILEISTSMALVSIWFSAAALITLIVSLFVESQIAQCIIFVVMSAVLLLLTRPFVNKLKKSILRLTLYLTSESVLLLLRRSTTTRLPDASDLTGSIGRRSHQTEVNFLSVRPLLLTELTVRSYMFQIRKIKLTYI